MNARTLIALAAMFVFLLGAGCADRAAGSGDSDATDAPDKEAGDCEKIDLPAVAAPDLTGGPSVVELDENNRFVVNDVPFYPFGFYRVPETEQQMNELVDAGFNTILFGGGCCSGTSLDGQLADIEWIAEFGMMAVGRGISPVEQIYTEDPATLESWFEARSEPGNMLFWYMYDEPGLHSVDKQEAADYLDAIHEYDPTHLGALVQAPLENYTEYIDYCDFMMVDPYPAGAYPMSYLREVFDEAAEASGGAKGVMGVPQTFDWYVLTDTAPEGHVWRPNAVELRNIYYQYAVLGANGMIAWNYDEIYQSEERWQDMLDVAAEIHEMTPLLLAPEADVEITRDPDHYPLLDSLREVDGVYYLMLVSTWDRDLAVTYDLSALGEDLCVLDYWNETPVDVDGGSISLTVSALDAMVLQIVAE